MILTTTETRMAQATFHFPHGFLWGAATSAHQVEGNNTNNQWWAWEQQGGHILEGHTSGLACDWWGGRWREDLDRAAETGQNAHRFSVEWSRIQPAPDRWDEDALDRYREMARGMLERGLTPLLTLHHFSDPLWLTELGGWENPVAVGYFETFTRRVVEALREYVSMWVTVNEPNIYTWLGYLVGVFPPGKRDLALAQKVLLNLLRGHAAAYYAIHALQPAAQVGLSVNVRGFRPARPWLPLDRWIAATQARLFNNFFPFAVRDGVGRLVSRRVRVPEARGTQDYFGLNYYTTINLSFDLRRYSEGFGRSSYPPGSDLSPTGFLANVPEGLFHALRWARQFQSPIYITENGVEDYDDRIRPRYIIQHLHQAWRAVNFNYPLKGYFHWSLLDNFEWERGWTQRFGLWELDVETQARRKRPSAELYAEICRENGISSEMTARYAPEVFEKLFPN
jgi:beta-glucosidase